MHPTAVMLPPFCRKNLKFGLGGFLVEEAQLLIRHGRMLLWHFRHRNGGGCGWHCGWHRQVEITPGLLFEPFVSVTIFKMLGGVGVECSDDFRWTRTGNVN